VASGPWHLASGDSLHGGDTVAVRIPPDLSGLHVLVVDDNEDARAILGTYLEHVGASVTIARNGGEALAALNDIRAHVIISDIAMPAIDGIALIKHVREREAALGLSRTPAIAFSGFADAANEATARDAGFDLFLRKPTDPLDLALHVLALADG
jgi:CheY-like chemotaxis protein